MNRSELETLAAEAIESGEQWIYLLMDGDPGSARQRLLGHHWGPKGWVVGHKSPENIVRFNPEFVQEYLDKLPIDTLSGEDDVAAEVADDDTVRNCCAYRIGSEWE